MYKFEPTGGPVDAAFRDIALSQLDEAVREVSRGDGEGRSIVHEARRRCKKLRGLLRLVRRSFPDFAKENAAIRDAAALLSHLRDAEVLRQTVGDLANWRKGEALERIGQKLAGEADVGDPTEKTAEFRERLREVRDRAATWSLVETGCDALIPGLMATYRSARRRMAKARETGIAADFHEWRKANKNHGFHIDLLKKAAPDLLVDDLRSVDQLSTLLGVQHDLTVLKDAIEEGPDRFGDEADLHILREVIIARKEAIQADAFKLGRQVFAERPRAVAQRFTSYWRSVP
jgi:hypothetical protein